MNPYNPYTLPNPHNPYNSAYLGENYYPISSQQPKVVPFNPTQAQFNISYSDFYETVIPFNPQNINPNFYNTTSSAPFVYTPLPPSSKEKKQGIFERIFN